MRRYLRWIAAGLMLPGAALAETAVLSHGADLHIGGGRVEETVAAPRDLLAAGSFLTLRGAVAGDAHAAGFSVLVEAGVEGDLYAVAANLVVQGRTRGDATLAGGSVVLNEAAAVGGNLRIAGGTVTMEAPVAGSAMIGGGDIRIDAPVAGDLRLSGAAVSFGPDARVDGTLIYAGPDEIEVPAFVAPPGRVIHQVRDAAGWREMDELAWEGLPERPSPIVVTTGFLLGLGFLLIVGALLLTLMPAQVRRMRKLAHGRPAMTILIGFLAFSAIVGLVPVSLITLIGIPLMPFALLLAVLAWLLGYLLGAYVVAMAAARGLGLGDAPPIWARLAVLAAGITIAALLNFVPFLGWMTNLALVFLGLGAMFDAAFQSAMPRTGPAYDDAMEETDR